MNSFALLLFLSLLTAHLLCDFILQSKSLVEHKRSKLWPIVLHSLLQGAAAYLALAAWKFWLVPVVIAASHFAIDLAKNRLKKDSLALFLADQALHVAVILLLIWFYLLPARVLPGWFYLMPSIGMQLAACLAAVILLTGTGGMLIDYIVQPFQQQIRGFSLKAGLREGGKMIGWLERLLIFVFILSGQPAGVGFLVAAKSILRFSEVKNSEDRKDVEYIIIGTFCSFLYAIVISLLVKWVIQKY